MKSKLLQLRKVLLVAAGLLVGASAWAQETEWQTVWQTDFSSTPTGMTYSVTNGNAYLENGILIYYQGGGGGDRTVNTAFTDDAFKVTTNWKMEFDWGATNSNQNKSNITFATNVGDAFKIEWANGDKSYNAKITDASGNQVTESSIISGYVTVPTKFAHFIIYGDTEKGIVLTVTYEGNTVVNDVIVSSTYGYPATLNGSLGRTYTYMALDNIIFQTPKVTGFVAAPTLEVVAPVLADRKFKLSCLTEDAKIYYAESDLEIGAEGWKEYKSEVTTSAETIYAYAKDAEGNVSEKVSFQTGAGSVITLAAPSFSATSYINGQYTIAISSNQSSVEFNPTATISYRIGETGEFATYSNPITINGGETVYAYTVCDGYANSSEVNHTTMIRPAFSTVWNLDFAGQATEAAGGVTIGTEEQFKVGSTSFYAITAKDFVSNSNFGVADNNSLLLRTAGNKGLYTNASGGRAIGIANLEEGQYVIINCKDQADYLTGTGGDIKFVPEMSTKDEIILKATAAGNGSITLNRYIYIQSIEVLDVVTSVSTTITPAGYATYCSPYALDFSNVDGLTAYIATVDESIATFSPVESVPANTGVLLKGNADTYDIPVVGSSDTDVKTNKFVGVTEDTPVAAGIYVLMNDTEGVGFYKTENAFTVGANTAYLPADVAEGRMFIGLDNETTGINEAVVNGVQTTGTYNLNGQRVAQPTKGLYIVNGKKVIIK